jgi:hypothetical protein
VEFTELQVGSVAAEVGVALRKEPQSVLVVGTSENIRTPAFDMLQTARELGIPTVGAVDSATNAAYRFRGVGTNPLAHAPDWLLVPDDATRRAFEQLGHPSNRIAVCGHPQYDAVMALAESLERVGRAAVRRRVLPPEAANRRVVLFAAEVSTGLNPGQYRRSSEYTLKGVPESIGRTEVVLDEFIRAVVTLSQRPYLVLRLHPKNEVSEFQRYLKAFDHLSVGGSPLELAFASDAVVGMSTMLLMEAALMGVSTLSIIPRAVEADWLPSIAAGWTACAVTPGQIRLHTNWL